MPSNKREHLLMLAAAICVGALLGDKLILTPLTSLWQTRAERIVTLEENLTRGTVLVAREDAMKARWEEMKDSDLPENLSAAQSQVLDSVERWKDESGLRLASLKTQWKDLEEESGKVLDCRASALGTMSSIARFLYELECDPLALNIQEIEITARDERGGVLLLGLRFSGLLLMEKKQ